MTPDRAAIEAVQTALDTAARTCPGLDHEQAAVVAVTTLQGLGWRAPRRRDTNAVQAWDAYEEAMRGLAEQIAAMPEPTQGDFALTPPPAREEP